jgi:adsorption protein B
VIGRHNGPSTKAENLNEIHEGMLRWENLTGIRYDIIVMHDSEDVIHPLSLKLHNYFIPTYDMVQLPVSPIEVPHWKFVHWSYADEFAEHHTKDLVIRQIVSGFVPSAGVGTGYNRWLIEFVGTSFARNMFRKASLTEDYDIALRLALGSARLAFLYNPMKLPVGTRAYFPMTFTTAVRQKTRWMIGICLQSWKIFGWMGNLRFKFTLYHDRKAVITNIINGLAYLVLVDVVLNELVRLNLAEYGKLPSIVSSGTVLFDIVMIDTGLMVWRFLNRFITVRRIYGPIAGLLSLIRLPIGNYINFAASVRGIGQYAASRYRNTTVKWDKTEHVHFPEMGSEKEVTPWRGQWQRPEPGRS